MRTLASIIFIAIASCAFAQSTERCVSREKDELIARIKEIEKRLMLYEVEIASLRYDTINIQPVERIQRIDSLLVIRSNGQEALLKLDKRLKELESE